jgi:hypothetical protein
MMRMSAESAGSYDSSLQISAKPKPGPQTGVFPGDTPVFAAAADLPDGTFTTVKQKIPREAFVLRAGLGTSPATSAGRRTVGRAIYFVGVAAGEDVDAGRAATTLVVSAAAGAVEAAAITTPSQQAAGRLTTV